MTRLTGALLEGAKRPYSYCGQERRDNHRPLRAARAGNRGKGDESEQQNRNNAGANQFCPAPSDIVAGNVETWATKNPHVR